MNPDPLENRPVALATALVTLCAASALDVWSGGLSTVGLLYIPAVALLAWRVTLPEALCGCLLSGGVHWFANLGAAVQDSRLGVATVDAPIALVGFLVAWAVVVRRLRISRDAERRTAGTDVLTGIANRKAFFEAAAAELNRSRRSQYPLSVAYVDCDQFKSFNDALGHLAGDALLRQVATVLQGNLRNYDLVARVGGDEFAVLLPEASPEVGRAVAERLRVRLQESAQDLNRRVTFSMGVVSFESPPASVEDLLQAADEAMYAAKRAGDALEVRVVANVVPS